MTPVKVKTQPPYLVRFGDLGDLSSLAGSGAVVVSDRHVVASLGSYLPPGVPTLVLAPGERTKGWEGYRRVVDFLGASHLDRKGTVIALGGGVVGDLAGFAAATYLRGVRLVQVPTSLLAMVDSSVGGKVGIDLPFGKNLLGAFHQPAEVLVCLEVLRTLPRQHYRAGRAEMWKMAYAVDASLIGPLRRGARSLGPSVRRCIALKARIVEVDERDVLGVRAVLNFGHTVGHALEQVSRYRLVHGLAVAAGMIVEARLGERLGLTPEGTVAQLRRDLALDRLDLRPNWLGKADALVEAMRHDKKSGRGGLGFSLLTSVGACKLVTGVPEADVRAVLHEDA